MRYYLSLILGSMKTGKDEARWINCLVYVVFTVLFGFVCNEPLHAQSRQTIDLTLDAAVVLALENSYRMEQLKLGIQRTRSQLEAQRAGLKSQVYMNVTSPQIKAVSDHRWNSGLDRYEITREHSHMWRMNMAIRQPVVLFGYPTNGYLSLNNTLYRYTQLGISRDLRYYNRYFIRYQQPLFQPNELKNSIEQAELRLEREKLGFKDNIVSMIHGVARDYYKLFELSYGRKIYASLIGNLEQAASIAAAVAERDTSRSIELGQVQVELANAREQLSQIRSRVRLEASRFKQRLRLDEEDSIVVRPVASITKIQVDLDRALQYGRTLGLRMRRLEIHKRQSELSLANTKGRNSFRIDLEATYGREMQDPRLDQLWGRPRNSYTVGINMHIPIWDWGRREAQVQVQKIGLRQTQLRIEYERKELRSGIKNALQNLEEYEKRALAMQENLDKAQQISRQSLRRYETGQIGLLDLLQSFNRQQETAGNFLDAYLGYRKALLSLQKETYYDFERDIRLLDRFNIDNSVSFSKAK